jgi:hypothetical protein
MSGGLLSDLRRNFDVIVVIVAALIAYMLVRRYTNLSLRGAGL